MRLWFEWIPEEDEDVDEAIGDPTAELLVATKWAATKSLHGESRMFIHEPTGRPRADQDVLRQFRAVVGGPREQLIFHVVVGDECDSLGRGGFDGGHDVWWHVPSVPDEGEMVVSQSCPTPMNS
jgi:hypothetical protein